MQRVIKKVYFPNSFCLKIDVFNALLLKEETPTRVSNRSASKVVYEEFNDDDFGILEAAYEKIAYENTIPDDFEVAESPKKVNIAPKEPEVTISKKEFERLKSIEKKYQQIQRLCK